MKRYDQGSIGMREDANGDIVKRLRSVYAAGPTVGSMLDPIPDPLTNEAADEIERLRQRRDEYANEITGKLMPKIERLRDQVIRLSTLVDTERGLYDAKTKQLRDLLTWIAEWADRYAHKALAERINKELR